MQKLLKNLENLKTSKLNIAFKCRDKYLIFCVYNVRYYYKNIFFFFIRSIKFNSLSFLFQNLNFDFKVLFPFLAHYKLNQSWVCNSMTEKSFCVFKSMNLKLLSTFSFLFIKYVFKASFYRNLKTINNFFKTAYVYSFSNMSVTSFQSYIKLDSF